MSNQTNAKHNTHSVPRYFQGQDIRIWPIKHAVCKVDISAQHDNAEIQKNVL